MTDTKLTTLNFKLSQVASYVRGVASHRYTGLILWGRGGIGKSFTVLQTLEGDGVPYVLINSRVTGRGAVRPARRPPRIGAGARRL